MLRCTVGVCSGPKAASRAAKRLGSGNADNIRKYAVELAAFAPDVILAVGGATLVGPLLQAIRAVPIVFTYAADPIGAGFVDGVGLQAVMNPDVGLDVNRVILFERHKNRRQSTVYRHCTRPFED